MRTKAPPPVSLVAGRGARPLVETYFELNQLKNLFRQGWLRAGVPEARCESVAEHCLFVALLTLFIVDAYVPEADAGRAVRMALLHDLGEASVGDITPHDGVTKEEKHRRERDAVARIVSRLARGQEYLALWDAYEEGTSIEARVVRQVDRLEMALQACVYELQGAGDLSQFYESAAKALESPLLQGMLASLEALRPGMADE